MNTTTKIVPKIKFKNEINKSDHYRQLRLLNKKIKLKRNPIKEPEQKSELTYSWDFTPFPKIYFPSEKKRVINDINNLNFKSTLNINSSNNNNDTSVIGRNNNNMNNNILIHTLSPHFFKSNSVSSLYQEHKGDITKYRSPAFSFGISREECKLPFYGIKEKISPCPGSYNLRPLLGLGGSSLKYSINKSTFSKNFNKLKYPQPGPGHYNIDKCDSKYNGNIILSNFPNSPICNFSKYKEKRDNNYGAKSEWNIKPEPPAYNVNSTISMFNGNGIFPLSNFRSNLGKSFNRSNSLSRNVFNFVSPGPGHYNHHSIFMGHKY